MPRLASLDGVSFGKDDAAIEVKQGFLSKVFLQTSFYCRVRTGQKFLVTGRKGSGKSAICFALKNVLEAEGKNTIFVTSRLLSVPKMDQIKGTAINEQERFESSWRYVFLVKIAIELFKAIKLKESDFFDLGVHEKKQLREIRMFLSRNNEINKTFGQKISSLLKIFSKFSANLPGGLEASLETRPTDDNAELSEMLDKFEESLCLLFSRLDNFKLTILVDEVDDIWDTTEQSQPLIIGLLNAIRKMNSSFNPNVVVLVFLRSDIWDGLSFSDKDKFRSEDERISWSENELKLLITMRGRITANLFNFQPDQVDQIWERLFASLVENQDSLDISEIESSVEKIAYN